MSGTRTDVLIAMVLVGAAAHAAGPAVTTGTPEGARSYYRALSKEFRLNTDGLTLQGLLDYLGYPIPAERLEALPSDVLMHPLECDGGLCLPPTLMGARLREGDILASRFFAPKIVNVSAATPAPGWRKLVRLRTHPDSPAARAGIQAAIILFNFIAPVDRDPFAGHSPNTQVMLIAPTHPKYVYWLDFHGLDVDGGSLSLALNQSFDAVSFPDGGTVDYFVPDGCNACHGSPGNRTPPMVNYLDTDHWFDRLTDDFAAVADAGLPLLFDAQTNDTGTVAYARAFDVIRQINEEALAQNQVVHLDSFEARAAQKWLSIHERDDAHQPPVARGFSSDGGPSWSGAEASGLALLNRYCFRCHGSVQFSVFDRPSVVVRAGDMRQRVTPGKVQLRISGFRMPPDRVLPANEAAALDQFLKNVK